jgi:hypothetical protein
MAFGDVNPPAGSPEELKPPVTLEDVAFMVQEMQAAVTELIGKFDTVVSTVGFIQDQVGPILAELQDHPMFRMLVGGRKR